jgi:hypothetical protein
VNYSNADFVVTVEEYVQPITVEWSNTLFIGNAMGSIVAGAVKQVAYTRFCVLRDCLFLLMALLSLRNQVYNGRYLLLINRLECRESR